MKLSFEQIKSITLGTERITELEDGIHFFRFTKEQEDLYFERKAAFYRKSFATSGVVFSFRTDSETLFLSGTLSSASSRSYYSIDFFVNGKRVHSANNFSDVTLPEKYAEISLPMGKSETTLDLGKGEKEIRIYLPWSAKFVLEEFSLSDGASIIPVKPQYKLLVLGDSITQGYDALYPSNKYVTRFAEYLNAEEINKAIGGEVMFPELAAAKVGFEPDYVLVAYGSNDWAKTDSETFEKNAAAVFANLEKLYPNAKFFAITPIWRKSYAVEKPFGTFDKVSKIINRITSEYENITVIEGFDLVEKDSKFFADLVLHPNDKGFDQYIAGVIKAVSEKK